MSEPRFAKLGKQLREASAGAAWIQWQALGGQAAAPRAPHAIVDPEALVLVSLWLADHEPRVRDFVAGFAEIGSRLLSVQRLKRALHLFPSDSAERMAGFAAQVASHGRDPRWQSLAGDAEAVAGRPGKVGPASTRLAEPGSLMLRLRTAFGVDVRTDTLTCLLGRRGAWADVKDIADSLLYAKYSVRLACEALADARFVTAGPDRPVRYYAEYRRWSEVLDLPDAPTWYPWVHVYAFALRLEEWLRQPKLQGTSPALQASVAREFMMEHGRPLTQLQLEVPDSRDHSGEAYLAAFEATVNRLTAWLAEHV
jgi:hypothetical protein